MGRINPTITGIKSIKRCFGVIMSSNLILADCLRPKEKTSSFVYEMTRILAGSFLIAISAQVAFGWPVPATAQTFAVLLTAMVLGSRRAALTVLAYICEGLAGLPVFAQFKAGLPALLGPTGGYIIGFLAAAFLVGFLAERGSSRNIIKMLFVMLAGEIVIYAFGLFWLALLMKGAGLQIILSVGLYPFVLGEVIKITLALWLLRRLPQRNYSL
jgi:biotin transport system substrate-specific component